MELIKQSLKLIREKYIGDIVDLIISICCEKSSDARGYVKGIEGKKSSDEKDSGEQHPGKSFNTNDTYYNDIDNYTNIYETTDDDSNDDTDDRNSLDEDCADKDNTYDTSDD